ncbi:hypothetical protein PBI_AN9_95 [Mycobacterium phage AN9]|nr:hypothetical protein PBI_VC3_94 [Mycobacterium phage VC3]QJD52557.1 hypothetical protein PBI_ANI8_95 [Mycobacterium phage ANI8]QJD52649.1 hypothetical protein PBI_AN9_95 [Mycobacterium phage AN9]BBC43649.1 hypothetical protein [Mycobacterium phage C3]
MQLIGEPGNKARNVKASERNTIRMPFVAPELSPVRTVDLELEKGTKGWTDIDVKVPADPRDELIKARNEELLEAFTISGDRVIRKAPRANAPKVRHPRPTKRRWS